MWGIIPAAGSGSRIQPLAFSKELLPVGSKIHNGRESPRAVSEYLVERMILAGATKLCFVISPGKADILSYFGSRVWGVDIAYVVQQSPNGLCDAVFRAAPLISPEEPVVIGLPDTIWYPMDALSGLPDDKFSLLLFPVEDASPFDAVITDSQKRVTSIEVKRDAPGSNWIWGAMKIPGCIFHALHRLWCETGHRDEYFGTLLNAWIALGGEIVGVHTGEEYVDTGTLDGYQRAQFMLRQKGSGKDAPFNTATLDHVA